MFKLETELVSRLLLVQIEERLTPVKKLQVHIADKVQIYDDGEKRKSSATKGTVERDQVANL